MEKLNNNIHGFVVPEPVGEYVINKRLRVDFYTKPSWWHRMWTKFFLGWEWKDLL